ncbi:MAG: 4-hydroxy-tetrahydrodipicolinate synthase [archaeon]|jgi:4-hydroxy-tetrahydrodipicolinate synthase
MVEKLFRGVYTAIITPFDEYDLIDYTALGNLIEFQIASGVQGIVVCGTTGESPTLSPEESDTVIDFTVRKVNKRVPVIAGTGSNSNYEAVQMTIHAQNFGADAILQVLPYYNKPTQEGMYRHFKKIAESTRLPIILYNIKSRCGVNLETDTLLCLIKDCPNIVAVKEASGDLNQIKDVIAKKPDYFCVLSGDDALTLDVIKAGGDGIISVVSNVIPKEVVELTSVALKGNYSLAEKLNEKLMPFFKMAFIETNPIPIKAMAVMKGMCKEIYRLPICELRPENRKKVEQLMKEMGFL